MTNRSKSCPPDSRSRSKKRRVELNPEAKQKGRVVAGSMPISKWLGRRKEDETQERETHTTPLHFVTQRSFQGLFWDPDKEWESKSNSDSSYTNLSEAEASWLVAFDDVMSQVSSKVSGMDELLDVLSADGEDPSFCSAITAATKNAPLRPKRKQTNKNKDDSNADVNFQSRFCACVDNFTIKDKFNCIDNSDFWENLRSAFGAHCDDAGDFVEMLQAKSREKMEYLSRLDSGMNGSPILRTSSGRRVQFEFDKRQIPFWARRSWTRRSGLQVISKSNSDKAAIMQSCLKNPNPAGSEASTDAKRPTLRPPKDKPIGQAPSIPTETPVQDATASMNAMVETTESKTATTQAKCQKQNSASKKLKVLISVARKVLPLTKRSVATREQVRPEVKSFSDGTEIEITTHSPPADCVSIDCDPVGPKSNGPLKCQEIPLVLPKPQEAMPQETLLAPPRTQVTPQAAPMPQETDSIAPKPQETRLPLTIEKVTYDIDPCSPRKKRTSKGSQSSNNSTLLEDWSSFCSKTSEDSTGLKCRLLDRFSPDLPGTYSPPSDSLEGLTIECQDSFESQEEEFDNKKRKGVQPVLTQNHTRTNSSSKRKDIHSPSLQTAYRRKNSQTSKTKKHVQNVSSLQKHDGTNPQGCKPRKGIGSQSPSPQPAKATNKPIAKKHKGQVAMRLVADPKLDGVTSNWFNFDELDDNGFPTNHFRVEGKEHYV